MTSHTGRLEKWLRIVTSIGALYLESAMHGAVVPLLSNWQWTATNATLNSSSRDSGLYGEETGTTASFTVSALFLSTGLVEMVFSPIAGIAGDRYGFDGVVLIGILIAVLKCLLYGLLDTTVAIVLVNRILQGVINACLQTLTIARIKDLYEEESAESTYVMAVAFCELSFSLFAGLFTGELFKILKHCVFLLFLPVAFLLILGILMTFRRENFHSRNEMDKQSGHGESVNDRSLTVQWRVFFDVQVIVISLCFLVVTLAQTALEPSLAVWMKSAFGAGPSSTARILGFCGLVTLISSLVTARILPIFPGRSWAFCTAALVTTGLPLILMRYSPRLAFAGFALCVYFFSANATRYILIDMCFAIAKTRFPQAYGLVFAVANVGWAASFLLGPLLASFLFGTVCVMCLIGAACILISVFAALLLRQFDSHSVPNCTDCFSKDRHASQHYKNVVYGKLSFTYDSIVLTAQPRK